LKNSRASFFYYLYRKL